MPTIREGGLNVEMVNWRGVLGAGGLTNGDRARLTGLVSQAAHSPEWQRVLAEREWSDLYLDGAEFDALPRHRADAVCARRGEAAGPAAGTPMLTGQRLVPVAVLGGGVLIVAALAVAAFETARPAPEGCPARQ